MNTICNPMNLEYRFRSEDEISRREAADPSVVEFQGKFWLFPSKSEGYWWSDDLKSWEFISSSLQEIENYAPDVRVINDWIYFTSSSDEKSCPIYRSKNPMADEWEKVSEPFVFWDPNMFQDDDGRAYLYWGCSNVKPIYGIEMDPETMESIGEEVVLIEHNEDKYGWERKEESNRGNDPAHNEGPWMTKKNGKYYLQYATPGTNFNVYSDCVYEGDAPLGPFTLADNNPYSAQAGGFITGAGHGSTFEDHHGNLWHTSTMRVSVKHKFERRLGLWPAGWDEDGNMYCNNRFGDYPYFHAEGTWDPWNDPVTGWMLLDYKKPVKCSSEEKDCPASQAVDEDVRTFWAAKKDDSEPWLSIDMEKECTVNAIQVNFAEHNCTQFGRPEVPLKHQYQVLASLDGSNWDMIIDKADNSRDVPHDYVELESSVQCRHIKVVITHMPAGGYPALSGVRVFGNGGGANPEPTVVQEAKLHADDPMTARISWKKIEGAMGYNVRWGMAPDKLYHDWLVYEETSLDLGALRKGQKTWVAVEAFNENGVAEISEAVEIQ